MSSRERKRRLFELKNRHVERLRIRANTVDECIFAREPSQLDELLGRLFTLSNVMDGHSANCPCLDKEDMFAIVIDMIEHRDDPQHGLCGIDNNLEHVF